MRAAAFAIATFAVVLGAVVMLAETGCSSTCSSGCSRQYDDCMKSATGAGHSDCSAAYQRCNAGCSD